MYNQPVINELIDFLDHSKYTQKSDLMNAVWNHFELTLDRSVYFCKYFAIRFSYAKNSNFSNTVLSLSALQKIDDRPFIVCVITPEKNVLLLANTTFLKKISHTSQQLRVDNIRGSFNGSDILKSVNGIPNAPQHFETLFSIHESFSFEENLERLVESTNNIAPKGRRFDVNSNNLNVIQNAVLRAVEFNHSTDFVDLKDDLDNRINNVQTEIAIAAFIDNVNIRGRIIQYLITGNETLLKNQIIDCLHNNKPFPQFETDNQLGDYIKRYDRFYTATDIKTKVLFLSGNPKGYNIDKLLAFLSEPSSVFMIYIVGISDDGKIQATLCSVFDQQLLDGTSIIFHWAGRSSRGVTQFLGNNLLDVLQHRNNHIDLDKASEHISKMIGL